MHKFGFFILLSLSAGVSAFADQTLVCDGHELVLGNSGKIGTLVMTTTVNTAQNTLSLRAKWQDSGAVLLGEGVLCGVRLPDSADRFCG